MKLGDLTGFLCWEMVGLVCESSFPVVSLLHGLLHEVS